MQRLRFATDDDVLRHEPNMDQHWPRRDKQGGPKHSWDVQHQLAMDELQERIEAGKDTAERFELGRVGIRDQERLRDCAACFALHFMYVAADTQGDDSGFFARKAAHYFERAIAKLDAARMQLDYDSDNSGTIDDIEKNQPFPVRFIRG